MRIEKAIIDGQQWEFREFTLGGLRELERELRKLRMAAALEEIDALRGIMPDEELREMARKAIANSREASIQDDDAIASLTDMGGASLLIWLATRDASKLSREETEALITTRTIPELLSYAKRAFEGDNTEATLSKNSASAQPGAATGGAQAAQA